MVSKVMVLPHLHMQVVLYHLQTKFHYHQLHQLLQRSQRQLMGVVLSQLTRLSILHLDCIHRSTERLQQEIMSQ